MPQRLAMRMVSFGPIWRPVWTGLPRRTRRAAFGGGGGGDPGFEGRAEVAPGAGAAVEAGVRVVAAADQGEDGRRSWFPR
jgi:hypothetical protein